jgi:hypothetical protein
MYRLSLEERRFMARVTFAELVRALKQAADYDKWEGGVPAEKALYIRLSENPQENLESESFDGIDGSHVVLDKDSDGKVCGIEIA